MLQPLLFFRQAQDGFAVHMGAAPLAEHNAVGTAMFAMPPSGAVAPRLTR